LQNALAGLKRFIARGGRQSQQGWEAYLQTQRLTEELAKTELPDPAVLKEISSRYFQNEPGLDMPAFLETRAALRDYTHAVSIAREADFNAAVTARLDELAQKLAAYQQNGADADAAAIGPIVDWLDAAHQSPGLLRAVRRHYRQPNLYAFASERLAGAGINAPVNDVSPVREVILGTNVIGKAHTTGNVTLQTVPSAGRGILDILMQGRSASDNVGYNGPVTIYSKGLTNLSASKRVYVDELGLHPLPAVAVANTNTNITGVSARLRLIERMAWKRIGQQEGQAEEIASQRAEARLERRIDEQAAEMLAKAQDSFLNKFRRPLLRKGEFPRVLSIGTTSDGVTVTALHARRARFAAPGAPPPLSGEYDLSVRVHESLVGNAGETVLGGFTLTDVRLAELVKELRGEVPEELQITEDKEPWSITFAEDRPFSVQFTDNTCTLAIHGRRFTRGEQIIPYDMLISAKYRLEQAGNGSKLTRDGDVVAEYVNGPRQQSLQLVTFRTIIRKKFEALFRPEIASDGLKLPGRWESAGKLTLKQLAADKGWLTLGWEQPEAAPRTASLK
jgi:hypothetical protein